MKCKWPYRSLSPSVLYFWAIESLLHKSFSQSHDIKIWAEAVGAVGHLFLPDLTYSGFTHRHVIERKFWSDFSHWISVDSNTLWMTPHRQPEQPWGRSSIPLSGMSSLQGKAKGVMECWHTKAVRLPVNGWTANRSEHSPKYCIAQPIHLLKGGCCKAWHLIFLATYILNNCGNLRKASMKQQVQQTAKGQVTGLQMILTKDMPLPIYKEQVTQSADSETAPTGTTKSSL